MFHFKNDRDFPFQTKMKIFKPVRHSQRLLVPPYQLVLAVIQFVWLIRHADYVVPGAGQLLYSLKIYGILFSDRPMHNRR